MRLLFASTSGIGHFTPLVPLIEAAVARGDDALVVGPPKLEPVLAARGQAYRIGAAPAEAEVVRFRELLAKASPKEAEGLIDRELFGRLCTAAMLPSLDEACDDWRPDLVLHETCEYASAVAAGRRGIPHAQVAISLAQVEASALAHTIPALEAYGDRIGEQIQASGYLTRFPPSVDPSPYLATRRFRETGPADAGEPSGGALPDWWEGNDAPLVYVTFGTMAGGKPVGDAAFRAALEAVRGLPIRVLLTVGTATDIQALGDLPANVHVEAWVPQADALAAASAVVCHGGSGTTFGTLAAGLPLVIVPMFADQPANARLVESAGAGLAVEPTGEPEGRVGVPSSHDAARIRQSLESVLADDSYRRAAQGLAAEMSALPIARDLLGALQGELVPGRSGTVHPVTCSHQPA
jgi:UDP:flavonoid glycosyltransferase YjiC (YdhE family)